MLRYDDKNFFQTKGGLTHSTARPIGRKVIKAKQSVLELSKKKEQGFLHLPFESAHKLSVKNVLAGLPANCTDLLVLGIGGSDLGGRFLVDALGKKGKVHVRFGGSMVDPDAIDRMLKETDFKKTCINIVSKSGGTIEPMSAFLVARKALMDSVGKKAYAKRIIATTDSEKGDLLSLAKREGYETLSVPSNVGGRFSVLSSVGLLPAMACGVDVDKLLAGARAMVRRFETAKPGTSEVDAYVLNHLTASFSGKRIQVMMPYAERLKTFGQWYRQLFAESLGKKVDRDGKIVYAGITPISACGPEDQHSQLQLYAEGPRDKTVTFLECDAFTSMHTTPKEAFEEKVISGFGGRSFLSLVHAERMATANALSQQGCPNDTISIDRIDEASIGELILFFEIAVAMIADGMNVNAFDQPGVELSKHMMKRMFSSEDLIKESK